MTNKKLKINGRTLQEQEQFRYEKLIKLQEQNYDAYGRKWERNYNSKTLNDQFSAFDKDEISNIADLSPPNQIVIAGRIKLKRDMGKTIFATIQDQEGNFQVYLNINNVSEFEFGLFSNADLGDFFGFEGKIMRTKQGEITVRVYKLALLAKAIRPLPEKWHGLQDVEERYRRRYLDLIMNENTKEVFIKRTKIIQFLREFLNNKGYLEVETPILQHIYGGALAKPFETFHNTLNTKLYLRIAPELHLKRLIVGGFEGLYEVGRLFRNEGMSTRHNPEFTSIELYVAYEDMNFMIKLTEDWIKYVLLKTNKSLFLECNILDENKELKQVILDFEKPWIKIKMIDSLLNVDNEEFKQKYVPIYQLITEYDKLTDSNLIKKKQEQAFKLIKKLAMEFNIKIDNYHNSIGHVINLFFEYFVEHTLIQPTFIHSYPVEISPLAKLSENSLCFTDRFELFIGGREYVNGFSELNNPIQQYQRFLEQVTERTQGNEEAASEIDTDYVDSLEYGMPPAAGLGLGVDRLVMLLTSQDSIKDVLLFPHLKKK